MTLKNLIYLVNRPEKLPRKRGSLAPGGAFGSARGCVSNFRALMVVKGTIANILTSVTNVTQRITASLGAQITGGRLGEK